MKPKTPTPDKTETRYLPVKLTDDEQRSKGQDLARAAQKHEQEIANKKSTGAQLKAAVDSAAANVALLSSVVASGEEVRPVICSWHLFVPSPGKKQLVRDDNGDVVETRDLTEHDTQRRFPGIVEAATREPKPMTPENAREELKALAEDNATDDDKAKERKARRAKAERERRARKKSE
jgi:hypothetical protein